MEIEDFNFKFDNRNALYLSFMDRVFCFATKNHSWLGRASSNPLTQKSFVDVFVAVVYKNSPRKMNKVLKQIYCTTMHESLHVAFYNIDTQLNTERNVKFITKLFYEGVIN